MNHFRTGLAWVGLLSLFLFGLLSASQVYATDDEAEAPPIDPCVKEAVLSELAALSIKAEELAADSANASTVSSLRATLDGKRADAMRALKLDNDQLTAEVTKRAAKMQKDPMEVLRALAATGVLTGSPISQEEFDTARKAVEWSKTNSYRPSPAAFAAVAAGELDVIKGYVVIGRKGPALKRLFPRDMHPWLDFDLSVKAPWNPKPNLLEYAITENKEDIGVLLVNEGLKAALDLALKSTSEKIAAALRAKGQGSTMASFLVSDHEEEAIKAVDAGTPFTIADIFLAMHHKRAKAAEKMLSVQPSIVNQEHEGMLLLNQAADTGNWPFFDLAIKYKANPNAIEPKSGETAVITTIRVSQPKAFKALIAAGGGLTTPMTGGFTPLESGINYGVAEVVTFLVLTLPNLRGVTTRGLTFLRHAQLIRSGSIPCLTGSLKDAKFTNAYNSIVGVLEANWAQADATDPE